MATLQSPGPPRPGEGPVIDADFLVLDARDRGRPTVAAPAKRPVPPGLEALARRPEPGRRPLPLAPVALVVAALSFWIAGGHALLDASSGKTGVAPRPPLGAHGAPFASISATRPAGSAKTPRPLHAAGL